MAGIAGARAPRRRGAPPAELPVVNHILHLEPDYGRFRALVKLGAGALTGPRECLVTSHADSLHSAGFLSGRGKGLLGNGSNRTGWRGTERI